MHRRFHGYTSPNTETRKSAIHGLGLFAKKKLMRGVVVAAWGGKIVRESELRKLPKTIGRNYAIEVYPGFYLAEISAHELDASDFINHSCEPNCRIAEKLVMITERAIEKDEELTADFSNPHGTKMHCTCGAERCKGLIRF
jgi:uncharacterized protein